MKAVGYQLAEVWWEDTVAHYSHADITPAPSVNFGIIIEENEHFVKIAGQMYADGEPSDINAIPRGAIRSIRRLKRSVPRWVQTWQRKNTEMAIARVKKSKREG